MKAVTVKNKKTKKKSVQRASDQRGLLPQVSVIYNYT